MDYVIKTSYFAYGGVSLGVSKAQVERHVFSDVDKKAHSYSILSTVIASWTKGVTF